MPSIAALSNATGTFGYQDSINVQANEGYARFECPTGTIVAEFTGQRNFGPYDNQPWKVTSLKGALYYEVADGSASSTVTAVPGWGSRLGQKFGTTEIWSPGSGSAPWSNDSNTGTTWQTQFAHRGKPYALRVGYMNPTTSSYTVDKTTITPSATFTLNGDPTGTPVNVTFSGSAPAIVPAAVANGCDFILSDWMAVAPVDRTDVVGAPYLSYIRSYISGTNHPYGSPGGGWAYAGNTAAGMIRNSGFQVADKIATPAGFTSNGGVTGYHLPIVIEARGLNQCVQVLDLGDSLTSGQVANTTGGEYYGVAERACNLLNNSTITSAATLGYFWSAMNMGTGNQTFIQYHGRLTKILAYYAPDVVCLPVWGPNSQVTTQAGFDASMALLLDSIERVKAAGAFPVLKTASPKGSLSSADDAWRKLANAYARNIAANGGAVLADYDLVTSDQGTPAQWIASLTVDQLHPNDAGEVAEAAVLAAAIRSASPVRRA